MLKYKRVSLKLSGEAMGGGKTIDFAAVAAIAREIKTLVEAGVEVGVTIGAGNIWRGRSGGSMDRNRADQMGMLATTINCMAMEAALKEEGVETLVLSTLHMPSFCDDFSVEKAIDAMRQGKVCLWHGQAVLFNGYGSRAEGRRNIRGCACAGEECGWRI